MNARQALAWLIAAGGLNIALRGRSDWGRVDGLEILLFYGSPPLAFGLMAAAVGKMFSASRVAPWRAAVIVALGLHALIWLNPNSYAGPRSRSAVAEFRRQAPCPSTGQARGACPGWVVDHVMPLCAGGEDHPSNMQWQTVEDARAKDRDERRLCRNLKR